MILKLCQINNNKMFNSENTFSLFDSSQEKEDYLDELFIHSKEIEVLPTAMSEPNKLGVVIDGIEKNANYAILKDDFKKYYYVEKTEVFVEAGKTKTNITLLYDEINNSNVTTRIFEKNSENENMFVYRSSYKIETFKPTVENLNRCSKVCENINNNLVWLSRTAFQVNSKLSDIEDTDTKLIIPIIYVRFSSANPTDNKKRSLLVQFLEEMLSNDSKLIDNGEDELTQKLVYINGEVSTYIPIIIPTSDNPNNKTFFYPSIGGILGSLGLHEPDKWIDDIKLDFITTEAYEILTKGTNSLFMKLRMKFLNSTEYDFCWIPKIDKKGELAFPVGNIKFWPKVKEYKNDYEYSHLNYAHKQPNFYCQKWNNVKPLSPFFTDYNFLQIIGVDNTFIQVFGRNIITNYEEPSENDNINNSKSLIVNTMPFLTQTEKNSNSAVYGLTTSLVQAISIASGVFLSKGLAPTAAMGTMLGITSLGQGFNSVARGSVYKHLAIHERMRGGVTTDLSEKKYINNFDMKEDKYRRNSIHIIENYLEEQQIKSIENDRKKFGDYINDYRKITFTKSNAYFYLEAELTDFAIENSNVNLKKELIRRLSKGNFINVNPHFIKYDIYFESDDNSVITTPNPINVDDVVTITFTGEDFTYEPKSVTLESFDDDIKIISTKGDIE